MKETSRHRIDDKCYVICKPCMFLLTLANSKCKYLQEDRNLNKVIIISMKKYHQQNGSPSSKPQWVNTLRPWGMIQYKECHLVHIGIPTVEIRRSYDRHCSTMGFSILVRRFLCIESRPWSFWRWYFPVNLFSRDLFVSWVTKRAVAFRGERFWYQ